MEEKVSTYKDIVRAIEWSLVCLSCSDRIERIMESLSFSSRLMSHVSVNRAIFFPYIPQIYLDNVIYSFRILFEILYPRFNFDKTGKKIFLFSFSLFKFILSYIEQRRNSMTHAADFMLTHLSEKRIANPEIREVMIQEINTLCAMGSFVRAMERTTKGKENVIPVLLKFKKTSWIPITNILWKLWEGKGFGQEKFEFYEELISGSNEDNMQISLKSRFSVDEDQFSLVTDPELMKLRQTNRCSLVFHNLFVVHFKESPASFDKFLNKVFNTINWCITEYTVSMQEVRNK